MAIACILFTLFRGTVEPPNEEHFEIVLGREVFLIGRFCVLCFM